MIFLGILFLQVVLSGCLTGITVASATCEHLAYLHDKVAHVEKAAVTPDNKLVIWVNGQMAGADCPGNYTVTASLARLEPGASAFTSGHEGENNMGHVRRTDIIDGWDAESMRSGDLRPVGTAPLVVLPRHDRAYSEWQRRQFTGVEAAERTVYVVVPNGEDDLNLTLVYVEHGRLPEQTFFNLESKSVRVPHRYHLLLWLPITIPVDAATLPIQLLLFPVVMSNRC
jgi:hypothetical protein